MLHDGLFDSRLDFISHSLLTLHAEEQGEDTQGGDSDKASADAEHNARHDSDSRSNGGASQAGEHQHCSDQPGKECEEGVACKDRGCEDQHALEKADELGGGESEALHSGVGGGCHDESL